jgi:hypothetical protein
VQVEDFWAQAKVNLQAGRLRLVFIADVIPAELRRIIEFLNYQMDPAQAMGIEVNQYIGGYADATLRTLVPTVVGQTAEAERKKSVSREVTQWDEQSFFASLRLRNPDEERVARALYEWAVERGLRVWWGKGQRDGSMNPLWDDPRGFHQFTFAVWLNGSVAVQFGPMQRRPPFDTLDARMDLLRRLNAIGGISIGTDKIDKYPSIKTMMLADPGIRQAFLGVFDWVLQRYRESSSIQPRQNEESRP